MKTYAAFYNNEIRKDSSSGGIFSLLAQQFDVIYGVTMMDDCYGAEFVRVEDGDIAPLRGSKYFQAKVGNSFKQAKKTWRQESESFSQELVVRLMDYICFFKRI